MKVAHLVQFFEPGYVGGMQSYVAQLARRQQKEGLDVSVLTVALPRRLRRANTQKMTEQWNGENGSLRIVARRPWGLLVPDPHVPRRHCGRAQAGCRCSASPRAQPLVRGGPAAGPVHCVDS